VTGGGNVVMGATVTNISQVLLASSPTAMSFIANATSGLTVTDTSKGADRLEAGGTSQTLVSGSGANWLGGFAGGTTTFLGTAANLNGDTLSNFGVAGNRIDVTDLRFASLPSLSFVENGAGTAGTLTLSDGTRSASLTLTGAFSQSRFALATDGGAGTIVSYH
jgi:hypothetical protein